MPKLKQLQTTKIQQAIKRANQRIAQLGKTYGNESSVYKQEAGKFEKGAYKGFITVSKAGREFYRKNPETGERYLYSVSKGGNIKFDTRSIMKLVKKEGASSKVNRLLAEIAGIKIDDEGNVSDVKGGGIPTVSELDRRTEKKLMRWGEDPKDVSKKEIRDITEQLAEFSENFQTSYQAYMAKYGEAEARNDSTIQQLYGDFRNKRLTYRQLEEIKKKMDQRISEAKSEALNFESENTEDL